MSDALAWTLSWVAGLALGAIFFGGLWWTTNKALASPRPALWFSASLLVRMAIAVTGFFLVSDRQWQRLLLCLFGFLVARALTTWLTRARVHGPPRGSA